MTASLILFLCVSTHLTAHRTIARCNDGDDEILLFSFFILLMPQSYNNN
jgi:hypothetical protein